MSGRRRRRPGGFTLLEVVLVLAILAVIAAALTPLLNQLFESAVEDQSRSELEILYRAIVGDQRTTFGYAGDVGDYPASLLDLVVSPGLPGWRGPYLSNPIVESSQLIDSYARAYEYYLNADLPPPDQLAIISGGPDRTSTNTAANPNVAASFTGAAPITTSYFAQAGNADNHVFPPLTSANYVDVNISNLFGLNIQTFDANTAVNAFVTGCPNLYRVTVKSIPRQTNDVNNMLFNPGFAVDLVQGSYELTINAQDTGAVLWTETFTHFATAPTTRTLNLTGLDSSASTQFTLTATNNSGVQLEVFEFTKKINPRLDPGDTKTYAIRGCAQVFIRNRSTNAVVDSFTMPFGDFARTISSPPGTLVVTNNTVKDKIDVYNNTLFIGQVKKGKTKTFTGLVAGNVITFFNHKTGALLATYPMAAGSNPPQVF